MRSRAKQLEFVSRKSRAMRNTTQNVGHVNAVKLNPEESVPKRGNRASEPRSGDPRDVAIRDALYSATPLAETTTDKY